MTGINAAAATRTAGRRRRAAQGSGMAGVLAVLAACGSSSGGTSPTTTVTGTTTSSSSSSSSAGAASGGNSDTIQNLSFMPASLTVPKGTAVTWTNQDQPTHTVTSDSGAFDSGNLATGKTFSFTFASAGTFTYHCTIHPFMKGTVTVSG